MEAYIPYIEIMFFLTSVFAPANVDELRLETQGQTLTINVEEGNRWDLYLTEASIPETFIISDKSVIRVKDDNERRIPLTDFLSFPVDKKLKEIVFTNGNKLKIEKDDSSITYIGLSEKTKDETWKLSWDSNQIKAE